MQMAQSIVLDTITKGSVVGVNYIGDQFGAGEAFLLSW